MWHKPCRTFHPWCLCVKTRCLLPYVNSNWSYGPETAKRGHDLSNLDLWPLTLTFCMDIVSVNSNNSWKFRMIRWEEHCQKGVTDGQTDRRTDGNKCSKSCLVAAKNKRQQQAKNIPLFQKTVRHTSYRSCSRLLSETQKWRCRIW